MSTIYNSPAPVSPEGSDNPWNGGIIRWWRNITSWLRSLTPPGESVYNIGQVTIGLAIDAATNFRIEDYVIRRAGREVEGRVKLTYTGPGVTSDGLGHIPDLPMFTVPDNLKPDWYSRDMPIKRFGNAQLFGDISNTGTATVTHSNVPNYLVLPTNVELFAYLRYGMA